MGCHETTSTWSLGTVRHTCSPWNKGKHKPISAAKDLEVELRKAAQTLFSRKDAPPDDDAFHMTLDDDTAGGGGIEGGGAEGGGEAGAGVSALGTEGRLLAPVSYAAGPAGGAAACAADADAVVSITFGKGPTSNLAGTTVAFEGAGSPMYNGQPQYLTGGGGGGTSLALRFDGSKHVVEHRATGEVVAFQSDSTSTSTSTSTSAGTLTK